MGATSARRAAPSAANAPWSSDKAKAVSRAEDKADVAERLGNYPELGRKTAEAIPDAKLVEWPELGHSPQVEAPELFHEVLLRELAASSN